MGGRQLMGLLDPPGFRRNRHGQVWLTLGSAERDLLRSLVDQLTELLAPEPADEPEDPLVALVGIDPSATKPDDPALARLFPDAYDDQEMADEFRRHTQRDLRTGKLEALAAARASLDRSNPTQLTAEECVDWLSALNDLRLTLGSRLGVADGDDWDSPPKDDPRHGMHVVYDWLTYHQDRLVTALSKGLK